MRNGPRKYICNNCSKAYGKAEHLIRHERTHTGHKPFACSWCSRKFSRQDSLARHQQRQGHDGVPPSLLPSAQLDVPSTNTEAAHVDTISTSASNANLLATPQALLANASEPNNPLQSFEPNFPPIAADDFLLPLTWPDSEDLLQSILTSNLAPWYENLELLPTQYLQPNPPPEPQGTESPWLTQESNQQPESGSHAIRNVSQIISDLSAHITSEAESAALNKVFLDACLHLFFNQFTSTFPVCHRPTFVFRDWTHPLLLNSIALGSLFIGQEVNTAKGEVLWKLAHTAVATSWHSLILHRGPKDQSNGVQLIMTALLGQTYAMLSGTARLRSTAQIFHSLGFYWARQCDMFSFRRKFDRVDVVNAASSEEKFELWRCWAAEEVELRALLGHYILDGQLPYFTGAPTCQRHASNPLPLPCSDALFQASTLGEWVNLLAQEDVEATTFRQLLLLLFTNANSISTSHPKLSTFAIKVVIEGLESFVSEANSVEGPVVGSPSTMAISQALGSLVNYIKDADHLHEGEKTELVLRWHIVCIDAAVNFNHLCKNLCFRFAIDQVVFGREKSDEQLIDLRRFVGSPPARRALLHAVAVWDLLSHLPVGRAHAIHVPICIFAAATIYCVFILSGLTTIAVPHVADWSQLMSIDIDDLTSITQYSDTTLVQYLTASAHADSDNPRNLLYDCNVFLLHLRQIRHPWSICTSLENIVEQWLSKCGI